MGPLFLTKRVNICPGAPKVAKRGQIRPNCDKIGCIGLSTIFLMEWVEKRLEMHWRHPGKSVLVICQTQNVPNVAPRGPKSGQNRLKSDFCPHKWGQRAYFMWKSWNKVGTQQEALEQPRWGIFIQVKRVKREKNMSKHTSVLFTLFFCYTLCKINLMCLTIKFFSKLFFKTLFVLWGPKSDPESP